MGRQTSQASSSSSIRNTAIATSGDLEQYLKINDVIYSHLINPHTGVGMIGKSQVTVIALSGLVADSLASSMIVMGIEKSQRVDKVKKTNFCILFKSKW